MAKKKEMTPAERLAAALVPKETQPYEIPANWQWVKLGKFNQYEGENIEPSATPDTVFELYSVPSCTENYPEIIVGEKIGSSKKSVKKNDVLLCKINPRINRVWKVTGYTENPLIASSEWIIVRNSGICADYLMRYFQSPIFRAYMLTNVSGVGGSLMRAKPKYVDTYPVPLPPLAEQERIVARVEALFAKLDEAEEKICAALAAFDHRRAALLRAAFTGRLTAAWRAAHGRSLDEWEHKTLNDIALYKKGPFGSSITKKMFVPKGEETYKVYEQGNAIRKTTEYGHYYISKEKFEELKSNEVKAGDILVSCAGTIGEMFKLPEGCEPGIINQALMRVRLKQNILEKFFIFYFEGMLKGNVIEESNGSAMQNIPPFKVLKAMSISLPPLDEQREIVRVLDEAFAREAQARAAAEEALAAVPKLRRAVLARAFRGELGTNDPAEPPALSAD